MKFNVEKEQFLNCVKTMGAVAKVSSNDVSSQVLLSAMEDGKLILLANNGNLAITNYINDVDVTKPGKACLSYYELFSFVNSFKNWNPESNTGVQTLSFSMKGKNFMQVAVRNYFSKNKFSDNTLKLRLFPTEKMFYPEAFGEPTFSVMSQDFKAAVSKVLYAINPAAPRAFIKGMNIKFGEEYICFAGTDALKLAEYKVKNTGELIEGNYLIPYSFIMASRKVVTEDGPVFIEVNKNKIKLSTGSVVLHGVLVYGEAFPAYEDTFENYTHYIDIDKSVLLSSFLPYLSVLSDDDYKRLTLSLNNNTLHVYSDYSSATFEGIPYEGEPFIIDVNGTFLAQTLETFDEDIIRMYFSNENNVLIFSDPDNLYHRALITPIKRR